MRAGLVRSIAFLGVSSILTACGGGGGGGGGTVPTSPAPTTFTTWRTSNLANSTIKADGFGVQVTGVWNGATFSSVDPSVAAAASAVFGFDANSNLALVGLTATTPSSTTKEAFASIASLAADSDFVTINNSTSRGVISNPKSLAWDYQSFGIWETGLGTTSRTLNAFSVGAPTTGTDIPTTGSNIVFLGKVIGSYVDLAGVGHTALAPLTVNADFSNRSLNFSTAGTQTSVDGTTFTANPNLDFTGQLTYAAQTNAFSGTLTTNGGLTGNSTGRFYGPSAVELGGVFSLNRAGTSETYSGAYGAKR